MSKMRVNFVLLGISVFAFQLSALVHAEMDAVDQPSLEFLEFLGEFEAQDGVWVDPLSLQDVKETESKSGNEDQEDE